MKIVILLTGTVNIGKMNLTKVSDPEIRIKQYTEAISFYLKNTDLNIVFVENSNFQINKLEKFNNSNRLEILTFKGNNYDPILGKGLGELRCINYAITNSKFIKDSNFIFKITGRIIINNINKYLDFLMKNPDINLLIDLKDNLRVCESKLFGFSLTFVPDYLLKYNDILDDSKRVFFEHILAKASLDAIANGYRYSAFPYYPSLRGISGSNGQTYNTSFLKRFALNSIYKLIYFIKYNQDKRLQNEIKKLDLIEFKK